MAFRAFPAEKNGINRKGEVELVYEKKIEIQMLSSQRLFQVLQLSGNDASLFPSFPEFSSQQAELRLIIAQTSLRPQMGH